MPADTAGKVVPKLKSKWNYQHWLITCDILFYRPSLAK